MAKTFSFCNQKGGVGKTTSAVNIATVLANNAARVLLIDLDAQANATSGLGIEKPAIEFTTYQLIVDNSAPEALVKETSIPNLSIIPSNADLSAADLELVQKDNREYLLKSRLGSIADNYDYIFIDCPPSLGLTTINALVSSNYIIIPLQCEYYALEGLGQLLHAYQLVQKNLNQGLEVGGVILTMADFRTNLTQQVIEEVQAYFKDKVFQTIIPRSVKISEAPSFGKPVVLYDPTGRGAKCYEEISREFLKRFPPDGASAKSEGGAEINIQEQKVTSASSDSLQGA